MKILVVEDDPILQQILSAFITEKGMTATVVGDGRLGVKAFSQEEYYCVIMDVEMPRMSGIEAVTAIRRLENEYFESKRTPIVAVTACEFEDYCTDCIKAGFDDLLPKPINFERLNEFIEQIEIKKQAPFKKVT